jgi:hypothetical protein
MPRNSTSRSATNRRHQRAVAAQLRADVARKTAEALARRYGDQGMSDPVAPPTRAA